MPELTMLLWMFLGAVFGVVVASVIKNDRHSEERKRLMIRIADLVTEREFMKARLFGYIYGRTFEDVKDSLCSKESPLYSGEDSRDDLI
jgi:hypothetical protein